MVQTDYLRYLVKIVECGSMNKAANALYVTQVALTKAMQKLEADLNCELLVRTSSGVRLTEKGKFVYQDAKKILAIEQKWASLADRDQQICGKVRVAIINSVSSSAMDQVLFKCRKKYPSIDLVVKEYRSYNFLRQFENRKADIGICNFFEWSKENVYQMAERLGFEIEELFQDQCYIFMRAENPLANKPYLESKDLHNLRFAMYSDENDVISAPYIADYFKAENIFPMSSMHSMMRAIMKEDVTIINTKVFAAQNEYVLRGDIVYKEIVDMPFPTTYYMMYPNTASMSVAESCVIGLLKEIFPLIYPVF